MSYLEKTTGSAQRILVSGDDTQGAWTMLVISQPPKTIATPHWEPHGSLTPFVLSGELFVEMEGQRRNLKTDGLKVLPTDKACCLINPGRDTVRYLLLSAPAGLAASVIEGPPDRRDGTPGPKEREAPNLNSSTETSLISFDPFEGSMVSGGMDHWGSSADVEPVEVIGIRIETLAEIGAGNRSLAVMRATLPPAAMIPLHSHEEVESFFVLDGELDVCVEGIWRRLRVGDHVFIPSRARHAIVNRGAEPTAALCVSDVSLARFFRQAGDPVGTTPPGPPTRQQMTRLFKTAEVFGHVLYGPDEQAAVGLGIATGP